MPFYREWDTEIDGFIVNRNRTGPPPPPSTGRTQTETGVIVGDAPGFEVPPATPVKVNIPGPREAVIDARGNMTPRWRRFFEELYRRTGALEDNINSTDRNIGGTATAGSASLSGAAPSAEITHNKSVPVLSISLSGAAPTVS